MKNDFESGVYPHPVTIANDMHYGLYLKTYALYGGAIGAVGLRGAVSPKVEKYPRNINFIHRVPIKGVGVVFGGVGGTYGINQHTQHTQKQQANKK